MIIQIGERLSPNLHIMYRIILKRGDKMKNVESECNCKECHECSKCHHDCCDDFECHECHNHCDDEFECPKCHHKCHKDCHKCSWCNLIFHHDCD
jgi:hypothetical protein